MNGLDNRRQLEIDLGAALNEAEALESMIDDLALSKKDLEVSVLRESILARHHAYRARIIIDRQWRFFEKREFSTDTALEEMKSAREIVKSISQHVLAIVPGRRDRSEKEDRLLERLSTFEHQIGKAIRSIEVQRLAPR